MTHSVDEAVFLGTRTLVMSARPGRVVLGLPSPFGPEDVRDRALRSDPRFAEHRERIAAAIDDTDPSLDGSIPTSVPDTIPAGRDHDRPADERSSS